MKKDDILIIRLVSVAVLLAALALIILFGARYNVFTIITDRIADGTITESGGGFPLYADQYYKGMETIYSVLFALLLYSSAISVAGIFLKIKGTSILASCAGITGIIAGIFLMLSKLLERNALINDLFARIYLKESIHYVKADNAVNAIPIRVVIIGILLIILGCLALLLINTSLIGRMKIYQSSSKLTGLVLLLPVIYGLYIDIVRGSLMEMSFSHNSISEQTYGILDDYYLNDIFFISLDKICAVMIAAIIALVLYKIGIKKRMVKHITTAIISIAAVIGMIIFVVNPPRIFGYITVDESVCDRVESVGIIAALVMLTDVMLIGLITSLCLDVSNRISGKKILIITLLSMIISIAGTLTGMIIPIAPVYIIMLVVNILALIALSKFTYVS